MHAKSSMHEMQKDMESTQKQEMAWAQGQLVENTAGGMSRVRMRYHQSVGFSSNSQAIKQKSLEEI